jgi:hypothetical protein
LRWTTYRERRVYKIFTGNFAKSREALKASSYMHIYEEDTRRG